jgi:hypothetical protein
MSNGFLSCKCISHLVICTGLSPARGVLHGYIHRVYGADIALWYIKIWVNQSSLD